MTVSKAKRIANDKWDKDNMMRFTVAMPIKEYSELESFCNSHEFVRNKFIRDAIREKIEREK